MNSEFARFASDIMYFFIAVSTSIFLYFLFKKKVPALLRAVMLVITPYFSVILTIMAVFENLKNSIVLMTAIMAPVVVLMLIVMVYDKLTDKKPEIEG